jgi:phosphopantetheinyl transferase
MIELILLDSSNVSEPLANPETVLGRQEWQCYKRLRSESRRREFLLGRILLKAALSERRPYQGCDFDAIDTIISSTGKPEVAGVEFNLSHDGELVLLAIGDQPVGVDIERVQRFDAAMMDICFTAAERQQIHRTSDPDRVASLLWCRKEAAAKATGAGLVSELGEVWRNKLFCADGCLNAAGGLRAYAICSPRPISGGEIFPALPRFEKVFTRFHFTSNPRPDCLRLQRFEKVLAEQFQMSCGPVKTSANSHL